MTSSRRKLSRRSFLAAVGLAASGAITRRVGAAPSAQIRAQQMDSMPLPQELAFIQPDEARLDLWGRVTWAGYPIREEPGLNKPVVQWLHADTILPLLGITHAEGSNAHNTLWYRVENGWLYTSGIQPMKPYRTPRTMTTLPHEIEDEPGFWAELIVPYVAPRTQPAGLYVYDEYQEETFQVWHHYGSVHRVIGYEEDNAGGIWYEIHDDKPGRPSVYLPARYLRYMHPEEFTAINPGADKRMEVSLAEQRIDCFEGDRLVFSTLTSSGSALPTPKGEHAVIYKQPSRHMYSDPEDPVSGGPADEDFFDLPGVPFNTFFTTLGHAIHGTWWHGDYGRPRSHGCLNVTPQDARWLYRWVEPVAAYGEAAAGSAANPGTPVIVT